MSHSSMVAWGREDVLSWLSILTRDSASHRSERKRAGVRAHAGAPAAEQGTDLRAQLDIHVPWYFPVFARMPMVPELYLRFRKDIGVKRFDDGRKKFVHAGGFGAVSVPSKTYAIDHGDVADALVGYAEIVRRMLAQPEAASWSKINRMNLIDLWKMADDYEPMVRSPHDALRVFVMVHSKDKARNSRVPRRYPVIYGVAIFDGERGGGGNAIVIAHPLTQPTMGSDRTRGNMIAKDLVGLSPEDCENPRPVERSRNHAGDGHFSCVAPVGSARTSADTQTSSPKLSTDEDWSQSSNPEAALATAKLATRWANAMAPLDREFRLSKIGETLTVLANRQLMKEGRLGRTLTVEVTNVRSQTIATKWGATPHAGEQRLSGA